MGEMSKLTAAPVTLTDSKGREYALTAIQPLDLGCFEEWAFTRTWRRHGMRVAAIQKAGASISPKTLTRWEKETDAQAELLSDMRNEESKQLIQSVEGILFLVKQSVRRSNPEITDAEISELVSVDNLQEVKRKLDRVSGLKDTGVQGVNPTKRPRRGKGSSK